jgi:hypothetical protein
MAVAKTPDAFEGAKVVVKTAVFHHQNYDVTHVLDGTCAAIGGYGQCTLDTGRKNASDRCSCCQSGTVNEQIAAAWHMGLSVGGYAKSIAYFFRSVREQ